MQLSEPVVSTIVQFQIIFLKSIRVRRFLLPIYQNGQISLLEVVSLALSFSSAWSTMRKFSVYAVVSTKDEEKNLQNLGIFTFAFPLGLFVACEFFHRVLTSLLLLTLAGFESATLRMMRNLVYCILCFVCYIVISTFGMKSKCCSKLTLVNVSGMLMPCEAEIWSLFFSGFSSIKRKKVFVAACLGRQAISIVTCVLFLLFYKINNGQYAVLGSTRIVYAWVLCIFASVVCSAVIVALQLCYFGTDALQRSVELKMLTEIGAAARGNDVREDEISV